MLGGWLPFSFIWEGLGMEFDYRIHTLTYVYIFNFIRDKEPVLAAPQKFLIIIAK